MGKKKAQVRMEKTCSRITKPPGGETSEIFGTPVSTPPTTPRKVKNYMASTIFSADDGSKTERPIRARPDGDSHNRLFGNEGGKGSPRGKNWQKSNIIFADGEGSNGQLNGKMNGHSNGYMNGSESGYTTPDGSSTCGSSNGSINGDAEPPKISGFDNGHGGMPGTPSRRVPPGGFSSKLW